MTTIVKRKGHKEDFDSRKIYASVYASCRNVNLQDGEAELVADKVSGQVGAEFKSQKEITSKDIQISATKHLSLINKDAAFMYETHRDVS